MQELELLASHQINSSFILAQCSNGSSCGDGEDGICGCPHGQYIDYDTATCVLVKEIDSFCSRNDECNATRSLICIVGNCSCDPDVSIRNPVPISLSKRGDRDYVISTKECLHKVFVIPPYRNGTFLAQLYSCPCIVVINCTEYVLFYLYI
jgi:hypothetical protein